MPPITTTTKQMISTCPPMLGYTDETGAATMPARTAMATPAANTTRYRNWMSMPRDCTISRLVLPARIIMPSRVRVNTTYMPSASSRHTPLMNRRYTG